jgi:acyl carrier protein
VGSESHPGLTDDARRRLRTALVAVFRRAPAEITPELQLDSIGGWDSMNAVTFTFELEQAFDVTLGEMTFTGQQTIGDVLAVLRERGAAAVG